MHISAIVLILWLCFINKAHCQENGNTGYPEYDYSEDTENADYLQTDDYETTPWNDDFGATTITRVTAATTVETSIANQTALTSTEFPTSHADSYSLDYDSITDAIIDSETPETDGVVITISSTELGTSVTEGETSQRKTETSVEPIPAETTYESTDERTSADEAIEDFGSTEGFVEEKQRCSEDELACADGTCIEAPLICDGSPDCPDGEDEDPAMCAASTVSMEQSTDVTDVPLVYSNLTFKCDNGMEIPLENAWDTIDDCEDLSDEGERGRQEKIQRCFQCEADSPCLSPSVLCDGKRDCRDSADEDEANCQFIRMKNASTETSILDDFSDELKFTTTTKEETTEIITTLATIASERLAAEGESKISVKSLEKPFLHGVIILMCNVSALEDENFVEEFKWKKNNEEFLETNKRAEQSYDILHISDVQQDDEGKYECTVLLKNGSILRSSIDIKIGDVATTEIIKQTSAAAPLSTEFTAQAEFSTEKITTPEAMSSTFFANTTTEETERPTPEAEIIVETTKEYSTPGISTTVSKFTEITTGLPSTSVVQPEILVPFQPLVMLNKRSGETVDMKCSTPDAILENEIEAMYWKKNDSKLQMVLGRDQESKLFGLATVTMSPSLQGEWICVVELQDKIIDVSKIVLKLAEESTTAQIKETIPWVTISTTQAAPITVYSTEIKTIRLEAYPKIIVAKLGSPVTATCVAWNMETTGGIHFVKTSPYGLAEGRVDHFKQDLISNYTLTIPQAARHHAGKYECMIITADQRAIKAEFEIQIEEPDYLPEIIPTLPSTPRQPLPPPLPATVPPMRAGLYVANVSFQQGARAEIECLGMDPADQFNVYWLFKGKRIERDEAPFFPRGKVLYIQPMSSDVVGEYTCYVAGLESKYGSGHGLLSLRGAQEYEAFTPYYPSRTVEDTRIYVNPKRTTANIGDDITLDCEVSWPATSIVWMRRLQDGSEEFLTYGKTMTVKAMQPGEQNFVCKATTHDGRTIEGLSTVNVTPLSVFVTPAYQRSEVGQVVQISCNSNLPSVQFSWYKRDDRGAEYLVGQQARLLFDKVGQNDDGTYICRVKTLGGHQAEASSRIEISAPYRPVVFPEPELRRCSIDEATCGDGSCIKRGLLCDGKSDCPDGSDERGCGGLGAQDGQCHPDQFMCEKSSKCVQKIWLCDGEPDCDDGSDEAERHCAYTPAILSRSCKRNEFQCLSTNYTQCIPRSYLCDETVDCLDRSDEIGCVKPKVVSPPEREKTVRIGELLVLRCTARGLPTPFINWRLNWGFVCGDGFDNGRCTMSHEQSPHEMDVVTGILTVKDVRKSDAGAYSCEAINTRGFDFAIPDAFVKVRAIDGFNCSPSGTLHEKDNACICKLNTMGPTCAECKPGHFFPSQQNLHGCVSCFCSGVSKDCTSHSDRRQAEYVNLVDRGPTWQLVHKAYPREQWTGDKDIQVDETKGTLTYTAFNTAPRGVLYWQAAHDKTRFPLGNLVELYGGDIKIKMKEEGNSGYKNFEEPFLWLRGNKIDIIHKLKQAPSDARDLDVSVKMTEHSFTRLDGTPIDRPHMLMTLADVDKFWIRAGISSSPVSVSLISVSGDIARPYGTGDRALEVEKCKCPPQYTGSSCEKCAPGYTRHEGVGLYLGECYSCREHCNGATDQCDAQTGKCFNCGENTMSDRCELCLPNYVRDPTTKKCQPGIAPIPLITVDEQVYDVSKIITVIVRPGVQKVIRIRSGDGLIPSSVWLKVDQMERKLPLPAGMRQVGNDLIIENPRPDMVGMYEVTLRFEDGRVITPIVYLKYADIELPRIEPTGVIRRMIGEEVVISINMQNIQARGIIWMKDGYSLPAGIRQEHHRIVIERLTKDLCGIYEARIFTASPEPIILKTEVECISSEQPPHGLSMMTQPKITLNPPDVNLSEGQKMVVSYQILGEQPVQMTWRKWEGYRWVELPLSFTIMKDQLILNQSRLEDSGIYQVQASNRYGQDQATLRVNVERRPPVRHPAEPIVRFSKTMFEVKENERVEIIPRIESNTPYTVHWMKDDGQDLPHGVKRIGDGLLIEKMAPQFSGSYVIEVITSDSQVRVPVEIEIISGSDNAFREPLSVSIFGHNEVRFTAGSEVRLKCTARGHYRGGVIITWSKTDGTRILPALAKVHNGELIIQNFQKDDEGKYVCTAVSGDQQKAEATVDVKTTSPISLTWMPANTITVNEGESIEAQCSGSPAANLRAYDSMRHPLPHWIKFSNGRLYIAHATSDLDSFIIICSTSGMEGLVQAELVIRVISRTDFQDHLPVRSLKFEASLPQQVSVEVGGSFEVKCDIKGVDLSMVKITWKRHGRDGIEELPYNIKADNEWLRGSRVDAKDYAYYMCKAVRKDTGEEAVAYTLLDVQSQQVKPTVQIYPSDRIEISEGESASLICYIYSGEPQPTITWTRDDNRPFASNVREKNGQLDILNVTEENVGIYKCTAQNTAGVGEARVSLTIRAPPGIEMLMNPESLDDITDENPRYVQCIAMGTPTPLVYWSHNNQNVTSPESGYSLLLIKPTVLQQGHNKFTCMAENQFTKTEKSISVNVNLKPRFTNYAFQFYPKPKVAVLPENPMAGDDVSLSCQFEDDQETYTYIWSKLENSAYSIMNYGSLLSIRNAREDDSGSYQCEIFDQKTPLTSAQVELKISPKPYFKSPNIHVKNDLVTISSGENAEFSCQPAENERVNLVWTRANGSLPDRAEVSEGTLRIYSVTPEDTGDYICKGYNNYGSQEVKAKLKVVQRSALNTFVTVSPEDISYASKITFTCATKHSGIDRFVWLKDGRPKFRTGVAIKNNVLELYAQQPDLGIYTCDVYSGDTFVESSSVELVVDDIRYGTLKIIPISARPIAQGPTMRDSEADAKRPILIKIRPLQGDYHINGALGFECDTSAMDAKISWRRRTPDSVLSPYSHFDDNRLIFDKFTQADEGEYACVVEKDQRTEEKLLHLNIDASNDDVVFSYPEHPLVVSHGAPNINVTFLNPPSEFRRDGMIEVECIVSGQQEAPITWKRESKPMPDNVEVSGSIMKITKFSEQNLGEYMCSALTNVGVLSRVIVFEPEAFPGILVDTGAQKPKIEFQFLSSRSDFRAGGNVVVECISSDRLAEIEWKKLNGKPSHNMKVNNRFLIISPFSFEDIGTYECKSVSAYGTSVRSIEFNESDLTGNILPVNEQVLPSIAIKYNDQNTYVTGGKIDIECTVENDPRARVLWHRGDRKPLGPLTENRGNILRFNDFQENDVGVYSCIASNDHGSKYHSFEIVIGEDNLVHIINEKENEIPVTHTKIPLITEFLTPLSQFKKGGEITIICYFDNNLAGSISWRKVDEKTGKTLPLQSSALSEGSKLTFTSFSDEDLGSYECRGHTDHEIARKIVKLDAEAFSALDKNAHLLKEGNPDKVTITVLGERVGDRVKINCKLDSDKGRVAVKWERDIGRLPYGVKQVGTRLLFNPFLHGHHGIYICKIRSNGERFRKTVDTREYITNENDEFPRLVLRHANSLKQRKQALLTCRPGRPCVENR